jgi:putative endonuclease
LEVLNAKMYSVYIIESEKGLWYYGSSANVQQRVNDHNTNRANFTRFKGPWILIFLRDFNSKEEALKFERELKRIKNKNYIRTAFADFFIK